MMGCAVPDPDGFYDRPMPAKKTTLQKVIEDTGVRTIQYVYDFGDDWDHSIPDQAGQRGRPGRKLSEASESQRSMPTRGRRWCSRLR